MNNSSIKPKILGGKQKPKKMENNKDRSMNTWNKKQQIETLLTEKINTTPQLLKIIAKKRKNEQISHIINQ